MMKRYIVLIFVVLPSVIFGMQTQLSMQRKMERVLDRHDTTFYSHMRHADNTSVMTAPLPPRSPLLTLCNSINDTVRRSIINPADAAIYYAFDMAKRNNSELHWQLFGSSLYPGCSRDSEIQSMVSFVTAQLPILVSGIPKKIEDIVLGAYMQKYPSLYADRIGKIEYAKGVKQVVIDEKFSKIAILLQDNTVLIMKKQGESIPLSQRLATIDEMKFNAHGSRLVIKSGQGFYIFDTQTGLLLPSFPDFNKDINGFEFYSHGSILVIYTHTEIYVWNIAAGEMMYSIKGLTEGISTVALSANGLMIAGLSNGCTSSWNILTGQKNYTTQNHGTEVVRIVFSPNNMSFASIDANNMVNFCDSLTGRLQYTINLSSAKVCVAVVFAQNGPLVASYEKEGRLIQSWDASTGALLFAKKFLIEGDPLVQFSPDGSLLIAKIKNIVFMLNSYTGTDQAIFTMRYAEDSDQVQMRSFGTCMALLSLQKGAVRFFGHQTLQKALLSFR